MTVKQKHFGQQLECFHSHSSSAFSQIWHSRPCRYFAAMVYKDFHWI